jgi:hypothetical protein
VRWCERQDPSCRRTWWLRANDQQRKAAESKSKSRSQRASQKDGNSRSESAGRAEVRVEETKRTGRLARCRLSLALSGSVGRTRIDALEESREIILEMVVSMALLVMETDEPDGWIGSEDDKVRPGVKMKREEKVRRTTRSIGNSRSPVRKGGPSCQAGRQGCRGRARGGLCGRESSRRG